MKAKSTKFLPHQCRLHCSQIRPCIITSEVNKGERVITAHKRSLRRLCFYRCLSVHRGGMRGCSGGACVVARGACMVALGGHAWLLWGGMCGCSRGGPAWFFRWDTVNERAVRILLECILVLLFEIKNLYCVRNWMIIFVFLKRNSHRKLTFVTSAGTWIPIISSLSFMSSIFSVWFCIWVLNVVISLFISSL